MYDLPDEIIKNQEKKGLFKDVAYIDSVDGLKKVKKQPANHEGEQAEPIVGPGERQFAPFEANPRQRIGPGHVHRKCHPACAAQQRERARQPQPLEFGEKPGRHHETLE